MRSKKSPSPGATLREILAAWSAHTPKGSLLAQTCKSAAEVLGALTPAQITDPLVGLIVAGWRAKLAHSTAYNRRSCLRGILAQLRENFGAPRIQLPKMAAPERRTVVLTTDELQRLFTNCAPWLRLFMLLYFQGGLRFSEILRITPETYNKNDGTAVILVKNGRHRRVQFADDITRLLAAVDPQPGQPYVFALAGKNLHPSSIRSAWGRWRDACGVRANVTLHDLRRTSATALLDKVGDLRAAQELLGHKSLVSTLTYIAPLRTDQAKHYAELLRFNQFTSETKQ